MDFESASPSVVKSIKQRDLLDNWLRLFARDQSMPRVTEFQPERTDDELPACTSANVDDIHGRIVAHERLLMPFSDGGKDTLPVPKLRSIIDRELFHRAPGRIPSGDILEFG